MSNSVVIYPSSQILELLNNPNGQAYDLVEVVERVLSLGFYRAIETGVVENLEQARRIQRLCKEQEIRWTEWSSVIQNSENLDPSSLDSTVRRDASKRLIELMELVGSHGAQAFAFLSGKMPEDPKELPAALFAFKQTLSEIATVAAEKYPNLNIMFEPLDRWVHKKAVMGFTREAAELIREIRAIHKQTYMAWDSAHTALNKEDLVTSLRIAGDTVGQMHLCNAILDEKDPMYGDYHICPGDKGYLTVLRCADSIHEALKLPLEQTALPIAIEARPQKNEDIWELEKKIRLFLQRGLEICT